MRVRGGSMFPSLRAEDVLVIAPMVPDQIRRGAVILAHCGDRLVAHRVRHVRLEAGVTIITTRGDNRRDDDAAITSKEVIGKVVAVERRGRRLPVRAALSILSLSVRIRAKSADQMKRLIACLRPAGVDARVFQS